MKVEPWPPALYAMEETGNIMDQNQPAPEIPEARPAPTTRLDPPAPTGRLDGATVNAAAGSIIQNAVEIVVPIAAFLAAFILTVPVWEIAKDLSLELARAIAGADHSEAARSNVAMIAGITSGMLMIGRVLICFKAAKIAARWVSVRPKN